MTRTRRGSIDMLSGYELLTVGGPDPIPYAALDYVEIPVSVHYSSVLGFDVMTVWGMGLVSFGPATLEQVLFMDRMATGLTPPLSEFPGNAVALGFSPEVYSTIQLIQGNVELTGP